MTPCPGCGQTTHEFTFGSPIITQWRPGSRDDFPTVIIESIEVTEECPLCGYRVEGSSADVDW